MERALRTNPLSVGQHIVTADGGNLERRFVYMDSESWEALRRVCMRSKLSGSRVISQLVAIADQSRTRNAQ